MAESRALRPTSLLRTASPVVAERVKAGKLKVAAGLYGLGSGRASLLD